MNGYKCINWTDAQKNWTEAQKEIYEYREEITTYSNGYSYTFKYNDKLEQNYCRSLNRSTSKLSCFIEGESEP